MTRHPFQPRSPVLEQALAYAERGWPVFPCQPGRKTPATAHGHLDASTDPAQITAWFTASPGANLAIATGLPGPDVLDIDVRPSGSGYPALAVLARAGLAGGASSWVRTPSGGVHGYFTGSSQRCGHLPEAHVDFRSAGGYVLAPPSRVNGRTYMVIAEPGSHAGLDWAKAAALLVPVRKAQRQVARKPVGADMAGLAAWLARQPEGNRNAALYWAANRALDAGHDDLGALATAARHAGIGDPEITATLASARRTARQPSRDLQPEPEAHI